MTPPKPPLDYYQENLLLVLSFLRRYGVCDEQGIITHVDMERSAKAKKPDAEAIRQVLLKQRGFRVKAAAEVIAGTPPMVSLNVRYAIHHIAEEFLPNDLQEQAAADTLMGYMQSEYPQAYKEYQKWKASPDAYFGINTSPDAQRIVLSKPDAVKLAQWIIDDPKLGQHHRVRELVARLKSGEQNMGGMQ